MYERFYSGGWMGALAFAAMAGAMGGGPDFKAMSLEEVEDYCVKRAIRNRRETERKAARAIADLAKATGPAAQHFGYCRHEATRAKPHSASLERMLGKRKRAA
jgi:hypothetical protein